MILVGVQYRKPVFYECSQLMGIGQNTVFHKPTFKSTYEEEIWPVIMQNVCPDKGYFHTLINENNKYKYFSCSIYNKEIKGKKRKLFLKFYRKLRKYYHKDARGKQMSENYLLQNP